MGRPRNPKSKRYLVSCRVDESTYRWLKDKQKLMNHKDLSSTLREIIKSARYMIESGSVVLPEEDVIDRFIDFLSNLKQMNNK